MSPGNALGNDVRVASQVDELHTRCGSPQNVSVPATQSRAAGNATSLVVPGQPLADRLKPWSAIVIVQGVAGRHLGHTGFVVKLISVGVVQAKPSGESGTDCRLARSRHSHHDHQRSWAMLLVGHECPLVWRYARTGRCWLPAPWAL